MKSWKLTFPRRRCPNCGTVIYATMTGTFRVRVFKGRIEIDDVPKGKGDSGD